MAILMFQRSVPCPLAQERRILMEQVQETKQQLHRANLQFNCTNDPDLIEAVVYEIKALQARYSFLLRKMKALNAEERAAGGGINTP